MLSDVDCEVVDTTAAALVAELVTACDDAVELVTTAVVETAVVLLLPPV